MNNKITIEQIENGYLLSWLEDWSSDEKQDIKECKEVIEDKGDENEAMKDLLFRTAEFFGQLEDRYNNNNLNIKFDREGSKFDN